MKNENPNCWDEFLSKAPTPTIHAGKQLARKHLWGPSLQVFPTFVSPFSKPVG